MTDKANLSLAICEYDHVRDIMDGSVRPEGIALNVQNLPVPEIFARFTRFREWDVSEMSLGMYVSLLSQGDTSLTAIPVFPSRMFRQSAFFVRRDGPVRGADDLKGARIGFPDWAHTAGIYARGFLAHTCGVPLEGIRWVQAGVNAPGHTSSVKVKWPDGFSVTSAPESSLNEMLLAGELDAIISSHLPHGAAGEDAALVRLFGGGMEADSAYYRETGIYPIMHVIAIRADVHARVPYAALNLCAAFQTAKLRSLTRMADSMVSRYPYPWMYEQAERMRALFGADYWPYGVERNRTTLEAFLEFCLEQGIAHRKVALEELFAPQTVMFKS